jgi:hypothetical protein
MGERMFLVPLLTSVASPEVEQKLSRMTALYEQVCLKAFPDDKAVEALMRAQGAHPLTTEEVKVTLRDDPGRAWETKDRDATIWIEFPPYHACSVRWSAPQIGLLHEYRSIADNFERSKGGFSVMDPYDTDFGDIHVHAIGEQRTMNDGTAESLFVFDQHITDPKKRAAGETGYSVRFVHQIRSPGAQ